MPSLSVICQREDRLRNSSARDLAASSWAIMCGVSSGCSSAFSSVLTVIANWSTTETRSWTAPRWCTTSALPSTSRRRCATSAGKPDSSFSCTILLLGRQHPQIARHREDRDLTDISEVRPVDLLDLAPLGVDVGLGQHRGDVRRDPQRVAEELHLGLGVLLRGIRDQQHGMRGRQCREGAHGARGLDAPDSRRVDKAQAALQQFAGQHHLGAHDVSLACPGFRARRRSRRGPRAQSAPARRCGSTAVVLAHESERGGLFGVRHRGRHARGDVIVDGTRRRIHERIHELALALLELPDDDHADVRIEQSRPRLLEMRDEVSATERARQCSRSVDEADELRRSRARRSSRTARRPLCRASVAARRGRFRSSGTPLFDDWFGGEWCSARRAIDDRRPRHADQDCDDQGCSPGVAAVLMAIRRRSPNWMSGPVEIADVHGGVVDDGGVGTPPDHVGVDVPRAVGVRVEFVVERVVGGVALRTRR